MAEETNCCACWDSKPASSPSNREVFARSSQPIDKQPAPQPAIQTLDPEKSPPPSVTSSPTSRQSVYSPFDIKQTEALLDDFGKRRAVPPPKSLQRSVSENSIPTFHQLTSLPEIMSYMPEMSQSLDGGKMAVSIDFGMSFSSLTQHTHFHGTYRYYIFRRG
jgi:hypothetical protein